MEHKDRIHSLRAEMQNGFSAKLHRAAVSLVKASEWEQFHSWRLSSGTLLLHNERLFVITCEHDLPNEPNKKMMVVRDSARQPSEGFPGIIGHFKHPHGRPDVALLELDPTMLDGYLKGYRPIGIHDIGSIDYSVESHSTPIVVGNTSEGVREFKNAGGAIVGLEIGIEYLCHDLVKPSDWPAPLRDESPGDPATGLYLKSIREDRIEEDPERFYYRNPKGLSGGGIWVHRVIADEIWSPSRFKLVGVQSSWDKRGYLYGTRIESVVELLNRV